MDSACRACLVLPLRCFCSSLRRGVSSFKDAMHVIIVEQQIIAESGGSYQKLEPAVQAIVQAAAIAVVECPGIWAHPAPVLGLLPMVPLPTAWSYSLVLDRLLTSEGMYPAEAHMLCSYFHRLWSRSSVFQFSRINPPTCIHCG
jgi:hypothetical protein